MKRRVLVSNVRANWSNHRAQDHGDLVPHELAAEAAGIDRAGHVALITPADVFRREVEEEPSRFPEQPDVLHRQPVAHVAVTLEA
jgi:hypothetical protein